MAPIPNANNDEPARSINEVSDMETPPVNIDFDSDDSVSDGMDDPSSLGYQLLPQEIGNHGDNASAHNESPDHQDNDEIEPSAMGIDDVIQFSLGQVNYPSVPNSTPEEITDSDLTERKQLWSQPRTSSSTMAKEEADKIKAAMSSFKLPQMVQPDWAKSISEDEWKEKLYEKLNIPKSETNHSDETESCDKTSEASGS